MTVRVLLVGEQSLIRQGLKAMLQLEADIDVVGEVRKGKDAVDKARALQPDVVLMNIATSTEDGVSNTRAIKQCSPNTHVLVLTPQPDQSLFRQAMAAGATGYELTDISPSHLANAIRAVHGGKIAINQSVIRQMAEKLASHDPSAPGLIQPRNLTQREAQILAKVAQGLSDKEIAAKLFLSEATVKSHLRIVYTKLGIHNRVQAAALAVQNGLLTSPPPPKIT
jgi:DNA-binding NarL/FixJ family response regulator